MHRSFRQTGVVILLFALLIPTYLQRPALGAEKAPDMLQDVLNETKWRSIGPATMGGRIADIAVDEKNPFTLYVALATGGLIKSTNNGVTWTPLFDKQPVASVGAVAIAPSDSKIVWAGTGEANGRNSSSWGDGIYKSTDSGATWKNMGLKESQEIARIVIDPGNPEIVYVAATGHLWGANKERGIFKTTDGGKTWQHSLSVDAETGAIDVALGAPGSNIVYAAMYQRRRYPWGFQGTGPGAGIFKSADAGKTWKKLTNGLPAEKLGRIGLSVCRTKPNTVYAVVECQAGGGGSLFNGTSKYGGIFRSDDAGETWKRQSGTVPRGFYFGQIRVDPVTVDRVYVLGFDVQISEDGGKKFKSTSQSVHSDMHALWIDPTHPERLLLGTDGGIYASYDQAKNWQHINNFPMGEFYEVSLDNRTPYRVYGGLQDNGSWSGPSAVYADSGPMNTDWTFLEGGDGFYVVADPVDPDIVYGESQQAGLVRIDLHTNMRKYFSASAPEGSPGYRFNWNSPVCISHFDHDSVYLGGNHVFKWFKKGAEWSAISPDMSKQIGERITAEGSGAETYGTVVALTESPLTKGLLWAGTDDGNLQITQDEGKSWTDLTHNLPGKVREYYVKRIEASRFVAGRAYVAIDGHRSDDFKPYLFVTEDFGKSWRSITSDLPTHGPVKTIREDPVNAELLFAGTEFGAFASLDRGEHWHRINNELPTVAVDDMAIHPRDHALVAATHGRSFWIADNIAMLEDLTPQTLHADLHLFPVKPVNEYLPLDRTWFGGTANFQAQNPSREVEIVYWQKTYTDQPVKIAITDAAGKSVADLTGDRLPGMHHLSWNMHPRPEPDAPPRFDGGGDIPFVKPGVYTVTLTLDKVKQTQKVTITGMSELSEKPTETSAAERDK